MSEFKTNMPLLHAAGVIELSSEILAHNIPVRSLYRYELLDWFFSEWPISSVHANWCNTSNGHKNRKRAMLCHYVTKRRFTLSRGNSKWRQTATSSEGLSRTTAILYHVNVKGYHGRMVKKLSSARHNKKTWRAAVTWIFNIRQYQLLHNGSCCKGMQKHQSMLMPEENAMKRQRDKQCEAT